MSARLRLARMLCFLGLVWFPSGRVSAEVSVSPHFSKDIRPILSDKCFLCHGPDEAGRQADLRLDRPDDAQYVLSPDSPEESEFSRRIRSSDPDEQMPPPDSHLQLSDQERQLLLNWVNAGSPFEEHWSFRPLEPVPLPSVQKNDWPRNAIDLFVLARLEQRGLAPSPEASRARLLRRLSFDLTGLPPTTQEIDAFLADDSPNAYETLVDRLLGKQQYGERMAVDWLDLARYSDSYGYQVDRDRFVWPWRDWVVKAFNQNLPYDRFLLWQLAGDLLPNATDEQILATTFNRLHPQKVEGGSIPEEFRVEYVADRTHTFGTAFLGLTVECARCHDHKFDPLTQREYYQLFSFFNNIDEAGLYSYFTDSVPTPTLSLAEAVQRRHTEELQREANAALAELQACISRKQRDFAAWLPQRPTEAVLPGQIAHLPFEEQPASPNQQVPGPFGKAIQLTGDDGVPLQVGNFGRHQGFSVSLWIKIPDFKDRAVVFHRSRAWTDAGSRGYELLIEEGHISAALIHFWPGNAIRVRTTSLAPTEEWLHLALTYDGSSRADGLRLFVNGSAAELDVVRDQLTKEITGGGGDQITIGERFRDRGFSGGSVDDFRVYDRQLTEIEIAHLYDQQSLTLALTASADELSQQQREQLFAYFLATVDQELETHVRQLEEKRRQYNVAVDAIPEIMVMRELPGQRATYLLNRGAYDAPGEMVSRETPAVLPSFPNDQPRNRLGLAQWLIDPQHPLTARVAVNRIWQSCFGQGLVRTPEDLGSQGQPPTHPQLLDWLARDFIQHGWDLKRLIKQMVTSATYRQSAHGSEELLRQDPENRLWGRASRFRLPAEMIRDNALCVSGLLVSEIGGPPARPYELAASFSPMKPDQGPGLYRRSLYTFWKRNAPAPVMIALDAAKRDVCVARRERTASPAQALVLWNDPQFVEAARVLGQQLLKTHSGNPKRCIDEMFLALIGRRPRAEEQDVLVRLWDSQQEHFQHHHQDAQALLQIGQSPTDTTIPAAQLAAATTIANTLMSFDECIMRR